MVAFFWNLPTIIYYNVGSEKETINSFFFTTFELVLKSSLAVIVKNKYSKVVTQQMALLIYYCSIIAVIIAAHLNELTNWKSLTNSTKRFLKIITFVVLALFSDLWVLRSFFLHLWETRERVITFVVKVLLHFVGRTFLPKK